MAKTSEWNIEIRPPYTGFAPAWYENAYTFVGNASHASDMTACDLRDPNCVTQGPGLSNLTNGTQAAAVTTAIKGITRIVSASDTAFCAGGAKLYEISSTAVTNAGDFPHTIDKAAVTGEDSEDVCLFQGALYYFYNHSGSQGDIGKFDLSSTFDDDWGSTTPTGAAVLQDAPHQAIVGADKMFFANGPYVGDFDGTTLNADALDFKTGSQVDSLCYASNRIWAAVNYPSVAGANSNQGEIFLWDTVASSWEDSIPVQGRIGALYADNGIVYCWYQGKNSDGGYKLGYVYGNTVKELASYDGGMPLYYQVFKLHGQVCWVAGSEIYAWGTPSRDYVPPALYSFSDGGYANVTGIGAPFNDLLIASNDGSTNYRLAKHSGLETASDYYTLSFDVTSGKYESRITEVVIDYYSTATGARVDATLLTDLDGTSTTLGTISHANDSGAIRKKFYPNVTADNFRIKLDWSNGSATNALKVRKINVRGNYLTE